MRVLKDAPARYWYVSGIVLRPELIGGRAIRILLSHGVGSWLSSANIQFPSELLVLAYSKKGEALLEGFNFFKIQNASTMPDRVPPVFAPDARNRLWRRIPSFNASLVRDRRTIDATGVLAGLSAAIEISDYRRLGALSTTWHARRNLLARLVAYPSDDLRG
jgi:hypothetical protein